MVLLYLSLQQTFDFFQSIVYSIHCILCPQEKSPTTSTTKQYIDDKITCLHAF